MAGKHLSGREMVFWQGSICPVGKQFTNRETFLWYFFLGQFWFTTKLRVDSHLRKLFPISPEIRNFPQMVYLGIKRNIHPWFQVYFWSRENGTSQSHVNIMVCINWYGLKKIHLCPLMHSHCPWTDPGFHPWFLQDKLYLLMSPVVIGCHLLSSDVIICLLMTYEVIWRICMSAAVI